MTQTSRPSVAAPARSPALVIGLCWLAIVVDGYDLIVYGSVLPALVSGEWALSPTVAGWIGSAALLGMLVGALLAGTLGDRFGRRRLMVVCIGWFSVAMALCALAPTPELFGVLRLVAGIGLGGVVPTAVALTVEYAPPGRRNGANALMFSGYSVGGVLAALGGITMLEPLGWRSLFWAGALVGVVLFAVVALALPESPGFLVGRGRVEEARALTRRFGLPDPEEPGTAGADTGAGTGGGVRRASLRGLLTTPRLTLLLWLVTGIGLLLIYGLNTWLAQIMRDAGYPIGSALAFLLALNLGAIVGTPLLGALADRVGVRGVVVGMFLTAATAILVLTVALPTPLLLGVVAVAGACTIGTSILVNSLVATSYPEHVRALALGWSLGLGRIGAIAGPLYGGVVLASGWGFAANFIAFAVPAAAAALLVLLVPAPVTT